MYMLANLYVHCLGPLAEHDRFANDTVSVTLSRVCIPRETQGSRKRRLSGQRCMRAGTILSWLFRKAYRETAAVEAGAQVHHAEHPHPIG